MCRDHFVWAVPPGIEQPERIDQPQKLQVAGNRGVFTDRAPKSHDLQAIGPFSRYVADRVLDHQRTFAVAVNALDVGGFHQDRMQNI